MSRLALAFLVICFFMSVAATTAHATALAQSLDEPQISARAAIVVEYPGGRILYAKAAHDRLAPASTTKILTSILAIEQGNLDDDIVAAESDLVGESSMGLQSGEHQKLREILYGLLLPSGNDAAMVIARTLGSKVVTANPALGDPVGRFAEMMNTRVKQMGLEDSHFVNPHGLDSEGHYSSAYDLASLSWYALHLPAFNEVVKQISHEAPGHTLLNTNEMLTRYAGADGIKTGWTDAGGLCLVTSSTRDGHRLISVVLNAPHWYADSAAILDYGFASLAAKPQDDAAEVLSVSKRGTVSWLLVNSAPAPPMPAIAPNGQGGGVRPITAEQQAPRVAPAHKVPVQGGTGATVLSSPRNSNSSVALWVFALLGLVAASTSYLLATRILRRQARGFMLQSAVRTAIAPQKAKNNLIPASKRYQPTARTLGQSDLPRRREPNLLLTEDTIREAHIERALKMADEDRQGASMSEFIIAMRVGKPLDIAELVQQYDVPAAAFLALSRAHLSLGHIDDARQTLLHGVLVLPNDRMMRLALHQLQ